MMLLQDFTDLGRRNLSQDNVTTIVPVDKPLAEAEIVADPAFLFPARIMDASPFESVVTRTELPFCVW